MSGDACNPSVQWLQSLYQLCIYTHTSMYVASESAAVLFPPLAVITELEIGTELKVISFNFK